MGLGAVAIVCSVATGLTYIRLPPVWARPPAPPRRPPRPLPSGSIPVVRIGDQREKPGASGIRSEAQRHRRRIRRCDFHRFYVEMLRDLL